MDTFTQAMLLVADIYNSENGNAWLPDHLNKDGSMQDYLAFASEQGLLYITDEYIYLSTKGDNMMQKLGLPMQHTNRKIYAGIQHIVDKLIGNADKETLKQIDRLKHMISQAIMHNKGNYTPHTK